MPHRTTVQPTLDAKGYETHPAFGSISASRISGTASVLFDSDVKHQHTMLVRIATAERKRDLHRDWIHARESFVEVEMSEAQWAAFVSSPNTSGVPCTIRATENDHFVPELPFLPRLTVSTDEVKDKAAQTFGAIKDAVAAYDALDPKAPARDKRAALDAIRGSVRNAESNLVFAAASLTEHAENVKENLRAEIEAMVVAKAQSLGLTAEQTAGMLTLAQTADDATDAVEDVAAAGAVGAVSEHDRDAI